MRPGDYISYGLDYTISNDINFEEPLKDFLSNLFRL